MVDSNDSMDNGHWPLLPILVMLVVSTMNIKLIGDDMCWHCCQLVATSTYIVDDFRHRST